jgi:hypothetical protein
MHGKERSFVFFWETEPNKFIFESARERKGDLGNNLSGDEICRKRLKEGNKKTFDWSKIRIYPIEVTDWIANHPEMFSQAKDELRWIENSILRKQLQASGFPVLLAEGKEKHQGNIKDAISAINIYLFGISDPVDFKPKARTTKRLFTFIENKYKGVHSFIKVLYGATMGAGKTSDFLHACQLWARLDNHNIHLCVTSMPATRTDLARDMAKGKQFQNMILCVPDKAVPDVQYILPGRVLGFSDKKLIGADTTKNYVVSLGVQDARGNDGDKYKDILKLFSFGMYGKDEVHTNQSEFSQFAKNVEPWIKSALAIYMTGTPEKFVLDGSEFVDANSILFLANDLYEAQVAGDPDWQDYPWRNFMVMDYKVAQDIVAKQLGLEQAQLWTLKKQWEWDEDNKILMHESAVKELIKIRFGVGIYADDPRCFWGPGSPASTVKKKTVLVAIANGDTAVKGKHVAKLIEKLTGFKSFSAHDRNGYDEWLNFCNNSNEPSVYVTHDKDMTGKNNPWITIQWESLNIGSSTRAGQHVGRGNRKLIIDGLNLKPNVCYFFDDPETALSVTLDPLEATTDNPGSTPKTAEKIHRIASYWFEGSERWAKGTIPDLVKLIQTLDPIGLRALKSLRHINNQAQCPAHLVGKLTAKKSGSTVEEGISDIEGDSGSNQRPDDEPRTKSEISNDKLYRQNLQKSITGLAKSLVYTNGEYFDVNSILSNPVIEVEGDFLTLEQIAKTPLTFADLKVAFDNNDVNESSVNKSLSIIKARLHEAEDSIETYIDFLGHTDLIDSSTQFITESADLNRDYIHNVLSQCLKNEETFVDLCAGRGGILYELLKQAPNFGIDIDPTNVYYNDIDPIMVHQFRKLNKKYQLNIPECNITCEDALTWKNTRTIKFDVGIGNPPINISETDSANGTAGHTNLYKQISDSYPIKFGGIKALITHKGIIKYLLSDKEYNPVYLNLMTEKNYWKYNTCYWVTRREKNANKLTVADKTISKIFEVYDNPNWYELNGKLNEKKINFFGKGIDAVIELPTQKTDIVYAKVDPTWGKILRGPKFAATLLENKHTYTVTDHPLCAKFSGAVSTKTIEDAEKVKLFVQNSKILLALHKKLKTKGLFWTMRHLKPFDPSQIRTGHEIPKEWNLTPWEVDELLGNTIDLTQ